MAKVGKKTGTRGQSGSRNGNTGPASGRKAPRRATAKSAKPTAVPAPAGEPEHVALAEVRALRDELRAARRELGEALAALHGDVRTLREEARALRGATGDATESAARPPQEHEEREQRPNRLGVTVVPEVVVADLDTDTPAAEAGLQRGDVVVEVNGRAIRTGSDLADLVDEMPKGGDVTFQIRRGSENLVRSLELPPRTEGESAPRFGVTLALAPVVVEVLDDSPAATAGLLPGDVIESANGQPVQTGDELHSVVHALPEGAELVLVVTRGDGSLEFVVRLDPLPE